MPARALLRAVQRISVEPLTPRSQAAFDAFYYRYYPYLRTVAANALGFLFDRDGINEVVHDAFLSFLPRSATLRTDFTSDRDCDLSVRSYLAKCVRTRARESRDFLGSVGRSAMPTEALESRLNETEGWGGDPAIAAADPRAPLVEAWLEALSPMEQDVVRTYFMDVHARRGTDRLPNGVAERLAAKYGVTTSAIRHTKRRVERELRRTFS